MKNLKISMKLLVPHFFILALLLLGMIVSLVSVVNIRKQVEAFYDGPFAIKSAAGTLSETLEAMQISVYRAISNGAQGITDEAISEARNLGASLPEQIARLKQYAFGDMDALARLEASLSKLTRMQEHVLALAAQNKNEEAAALMESNSVPVVNEARKELTQFIRSVEIKEQLLVDSLRHAQRKAIIFLIILGAVGVLFAIRDGAYFWRLHNGLRQSRQCHSEQLNRHRLKAGGFGGRLKPPKAH